MKYFYVVLTLVFLVACTTSKPKERVVVIDEKPEVSKKDSISFFLEHYEKFFATNFNVSECPGAAVVVVKGDAVIYKKGFGV